MSILEGIVIGALAATFVPWFWRRLRDVGAPVTHDKEWVYVTCPVCRRRGKRVRASIEQAIVSHERLELIVHFNKWTRCHHSLATKDRKGCGARITAQFMEHPLVMELLERKAIADAANEEIMREAAPDPAKVST